MKRISELEKFYLKSACKGCEKKKRKRTGCGYILLGGIVSVLNSKDVVRKSGCLNWESADAAAQ